MRSWMILPLAWMLAGLLAGCGSGGPPKHPVVGTVLVNGTPAARVNVCFQHTDPAVTGNARSPVAVTDEAGRFTLSTDGDKDGVVTGEYVVTFFWLSSNDPNSAYDRFGGAFGDAATSAHRVTVPVAGELPPFKLDIDPKRLVDRKPAAKQKFD